MNNMQKKKIIKYISLVLVLSFIFNPIAVFAQDISPSYFLQNDTTDAILSSEKAYSNYFLGMGDVIDVHLIVGNNALSLDYTFEIASNGAIFFPNIGEIKLSGLKIEEAQKKLKSEIAKKYHEPFRLTLVLKKPRLTRVYLSKDDYIQSLANIEKYVFIYGEVARPGRYTYFTGKKLSDYINLAGGPTAPANLYYVTITRNENGKTEKFVVNADKILFNADKTHDIEIKEGDIISVPKNWFYFSDFASFANLVLLSLTFYATVSNYLK